MYMLSISVDRPRVGPKQRSERPRRVNQQVGLQRQARGAAAMSASRSAPPRNSRRQVSVSVPKFDEFARGGTDAAPETTTCTLTSDVRRLRRPLSLFTSCRRGSRANLVPSIESIRNANSQRSKLCDHSQQVSHEKSERPPAAWPRLIFTQLGRQRAHDVVRRDRDALD